MKANLAAMLGPFIGLEVPGGCDACDAFQTVEPDEHAAAIWHVRIHHDDACPAYRAMQVRR